MAVAKACVFISEDPHGRRLNWNANWVASLFAIASVSVSMGRVNQLELSFKRFKWVYSLFFLETFQMGLFPPFS
jgi:hypothetical protein